MIALVGVLLAAAGGPVGLVDPWSPGASDAGWETIEHVQAWPAFRSEHPNWDRVARHPDPLVRAATAAALGRGRPPQAVTLLTRLVQDGHTLVRNVALWALLYIGSPDTRQPILSALADWPVLHTSETFTAGVPAGGFDQMLQHIGLPSAELARPWPERAAWVARFDPTAWTMASLLNGPRLVPARVALAVERSQWDADEGTILSASFDLRDTPKADLLLWVSSLQPLGPQGFRTDRRRRQGLSQLQTTRGSGTFEVTPATTPQKLLLPGDGGLLPGVYELRGVPCANPLFFRIRRSRLVEHAIPSLIAAASKDDDAVRQLGALRSRAAAPALLRRLEEWQKLEEPRKREQWDEVVGIIRALAPLQTEQTARAVAHQVLTYPDHSLSEFLWMAGEPARPIVEDHVVRWRDNKTRSTGALHAALGFPGFAPESRFAHAVDEMASSLRPWGPTDSDAYLRRAAIYRLASLAPDRAVELMVAALREAHPYPLLVKRPLDLDEAAMTDPLRRRVWPIVRDDPAVPAEIKKELAESIPPAQR